MFLQTMPAVAKVATRTVDMTKLLFKNLCLKVPEFERFIFERGKKTEYWDDGFLHAKRYGIRAIFNVGQDHNSHIQADKVRRILGKLKIEVTDDVMPTYYSDMPE